MRYLIALICPPLAILLCGKPFQAMLAVPVSIFYFPGALWALLVVSSTNAERRHKQQLGAIEKQTQSMVQAVERLGRTVQASPMPAPGTRPTPAPAPKPVATSATPVPIKPRITLAEIKAGVIGAKDAAFQAYQDLPEWAQPITWGLAAGTPVSVGVILFMLMKR